MLRTFEGLNAELAPARRRAAAVRVPSERRPVDLLRGGAPLPDVLLEEYGKRFGRDFSRIRLHADAAAAGVARRMNAEALTIGNNIYFGQDRLQPGTAEGRRLLAHELVHTLQPAGEGMSTPGDAAELAAEHGAAAVSRGEAVRVHAGPRPGAIRRQPLPGAGAAPLTLPDVDLAPQMSPFLAAAVGSMDLANFPTGVAEPTPDQLKQLGILSVAIAGLLKTYTLSTITITGHADTVGTESNNAKLGQERADAVEAALSGLGVPDIMDTESRGEGPAQAVATRDNVSNARNRRVEIRFHPRKSPLGRLVPGLEPAPAPPGVTFGGPGGAMDQKKPIDIHYHPKDIPDDGIHLPSDFYKPLPPPIKGTGPKSVLDTISGALIDPVIDHVAGWLSKDKRDWLKEKARDAVTAGAVSLATSAAEQLGIHDAQGLNAIKKAVEAAIKEKGGDEPQ